MGRAACRLIMRRGLRLGLVLGVLGSLPAAAQTVQEKVPELQDVGVTEHLGARVPADIELRAEDGSTLTLGRLLGRGKPLILTLNYYRCPMLCGLQLNGLLEGLKGLAWKVGDRFEVVTVSIDPTEGPEIARAKKATYLQAYGRPGTDSGWRFLTGDAESIRRLAKAVGFGYRWDRETNQYAHPAVAMLLAADGTIVRYLYGIEYPAKTLKLALTEAGRGEIGTPWDRFILTCFHYDPQSRRYTPMATGIMRAGGALTAAVLGLVLGTFWLRERRRRADGEDGR